MVWAEPKYSKSKVDKAGKQIVDGSIDIFTYFGQLEVVNNWRASHNFPLNTFQTGLRKKGRQFDINCLVAQRIKRFSSIENKLRRFPTMTLSQMQDIGGCRAVLANVSNVSDLVESYLQSQVKHKLHHHDDYIRLPKQSGYRGVHLVYRYFSDRKETYNSLLIEVRIRSQYQHAWATAVETVGAFVGQALKSNQGEDKWLRFFALMGTAISNLEETPNVPGTPTGSTLIRKELAEYARELDVENRLKGYNAALQITEDQGKRADHFFLIVLEQIRFIRVHSRKR